MKPIITKGFGALTPDTWRRIIEAVNFVEQRRGTLNSAAPLASQTSTRDNKQDDGAFFYAKIAGNAELVGGGGFTERWKYSWTRVVLGGSTNECTVLTSGDFDELTGSVANVEQPTWAVNENELGNTAALKNCYAINTNTNSIVNANGLSVAPIPTGTIVRMSTYRSAGGGGGFSGRKFFVFSMTNPIIGTCIP